jgi:hypothetical protein
MMVKQREIIDVLDLLCEARNLSDAAEMAVEAMGDHVQRNAMARLIGTISDRLKLVNELLLQLKDGADK